MRIGILGVGAIGGVIGGYLARAGRDVTLIDMWPANVDRIKADGLKVTTIEGVFTVEAPALHLSEVSTARPGFDAAILAMKSYDTRWTTDLPSCRIWRRAATSSRRRTGSTRTPSRGSPAGRGSSAAS